MKYRYHFGFKLLAFLLAICALTACFGGLAVAVVACQDGLYEHTPEEVFLLALESRANNLAQWVLDRYTAVNLGECDSNALAYAGRDYSDAELSRWATVSMDSWDYRIEDLAGKVMESTYSGRISGDITTYSFRLSSSYPVHVTSKEAGEMAEYTDWAWRDYYTTETEEHYLYYYDSPTYNVTVRLRSDSLVTYGNLSRGQMGWLYAVRYWALALFGVGLLMLVLCAIYLCRAAGRSPRHDGVRLLGLTKLPLDLYGGAVGLGAAVLVAFGVDLANDFLYNGYNSHYFWGLIAATGMVCAAVLLAGLWLYAFVAQIKMKGGCWWRRSLIGWCLRQIFRSIRFCFRAVRKLFYLLPLIWQWLLTALAMVAVPLFCLFLVAVTYGFFRFVFILWLVAACLADIAVVYYGAYAFGILLKGAKQMREGDLNAKIPTRYLFGAFRDFADQLNSLADTAMEAARNQMKSERMKSELITNVSHDIKTPLTSLINYVDLLEKPHTEEEGRQYLEVLSRQSQKLKKLIDDLMDMSKADSGAMNVDITQVDAAEVLNQAMGEFADKLEALNLTPVFRQPEEPVMMRCDGRLTWRVMNNLLGNIVKYALPGTRVYIDLAQMDNQVAISLKNISREELNVSADELTERFVRGDASRNTDGSGLGLNIAQSLMQLQQGDLRLLIDGDLFKVTLTFPAA